MVACPNANVIPDTWSYVISRVASRASSLWRPTGRSAEHAKFRIFQIGPLLAEIRSILLNEVDSHLLVFTNNHTIIWICPSVCPSVPHLLSRLWTHNNILMVNCQSHPNVPHIPHYQCVNPSIIVRLHDQGASNIIRLTEGFRKVMAFDIFPFEVAHFHSLAQRTQIEEFQCSTCELICILSSSILCYFRVVPPKQNQNQLQSMHSCLVIQDKILSQKY